MVKRTADLDAVFGCLSHPTRRDILRRVMTKELSVTDIGKPYDLSFPAVSKHLRVLEEAKLIKRRREGKIFFVSLAPEALEDAAEYLEQYRALWEDRFNRLERFLSSSNHSS